MPTTNTQDIWKIRSIDTVHINPSILEGTKLYPSILGSDAAIQIVRYAPTFTVQPSISGLFTIPSIMTCNPGVIDASPNPDLFYQWYADGVEIVGETNATMTTILSMDGMDITCSVDAVNSLGFATGISNAITVERIEPVINQEYNYYVVQGLNQVEHINLMHSDYVIITGQAHDIRLDQEMSIQYVLTGLGADNAGYTYDMDIHVISGLERETAITGLENDLYVVWFPTLLEELVITNSDASDSGTTGWIVDSGTPDRMTYSSTYQLSPHLGTGFWYGGDQSSDSSMHQDIAVNALSETDIDAGIAFAELHWVGSSRYGMDEVGVELVFLDATDQILNQTNYGTTAPHKRHWNIIISDLVPIPPLTRKVRIILNWHWISGSKSDGYIDSVQVKLWKDG